VLPSFLQIDDSHKLSVTATEKELISLRQEVDRLKREAFSYAVSKAQVEVLRSSLAIPSKAILSSSFNTFLQNQYERELKEIGGAPKGGFPKDAPIAPSFPPPSETKSDDAEAEKP
jgi:hypothetical protein